MIKETSKKFLAYEDLQEKMAKRANQVHRVHKASRASKAFKASKAPREIKETRETSDLKDLRELPVKMELTAILPSVELTIGPPLTSRLLNPMSTMQF
jgi:hypothetical protein